MKDLVPEGFEHWLQAPIRSLLCPYLLQEACPSGLIPGVTGRLVLAELHNVQKSCWDEMRHEGRVQPEDLLCYLVVLVVKRGMGFSV